MLGCPCAVHSSDRAGGGDPGSASRTAVSIRAESLVSCCLRFLGLRLLRPKRDCVASEFELMEIVQAAACSIIMRFHVRYMQRPLYNIPLTHAFGSELVVCQLILTPDPFSRVPSGRPPSLPRPGPSTWLGANRSAWGGGSGSASRADIGAAGATEIAAARHAARCTQKTLATTCSS